MTDDKNLTYKDKKVITIGVVSELTGLSVRQIRYYEERKLIHPERSSGGTRKYSFGDVESLVHIANQMEDGVQTYEIRQMMKRSQKRKEDVRKEMLKGQLNAHFKMHNQM